MTAKEFFFKFQQRIKAAGPLPSDFSFRTTFMERVIEQVLDEPRLGRQREFNNLDFCAWQRCDSPHHKPAYPLQMAIIVEHENGPYPNKEFWKLLHWYAPLKVIICYHPSPKSFLKEMNELRHLVNEFHPRSPNEEYLFIFGQPECHGSCNAALWIAWAARTCDREFSRLDAPLEPAPAEA